MAIEFRQEMNMKCHYCNEKAKVLHYRENFMITRIRFYCYEHDLQSKIRK